MCMYHHTLYTTYKYTHYIKEQKIWAVANALRRGITHFFHPFLLPPPPGKEKGEFFQIYV